MGAIHVRLNDSLAGVSDLGVQLEIYHENDTTKEAYIFFDRKICHVKVYDYEVNENSHKVLTIIQKFDLYTLYEQSSDIHFKDTLAFLSIEFYPTYVRSVDQWATRGIVRIEHFLFRFIEDRKDQYVKIYRLSGIYKYQTDNPDEMEWVQNQILQYKFESKLLKIWSEKSPFSKDNAGSTYCALFDIVQMDTALQKAKGTYVKVELEFCSSEGVCMGARSIILEWEVDLLADTPIINPPFFTIDDWKQSILT